MIILIMLLIFSTAYVVHAEIPDENKTTYYIGLVIILVIILLIEIF